ncbi:DUF5681 domain-containing protein [Bradyrhizobium erythrophlei]|nr:DUF5681 domain-containing protein [Bradyrhizobium erythrophlei]
MSDTASADEKQRPAHWFKPGQSGNPAGRQRGSRNRLADSFVADLAAAWNEHGEAALKACALEHPEKFVRVVADLMPRTLDLNIAVDVVAFADRFARAAELLGNIDTPKPRKALPNQPPKVIEHGG